jgi:Domain of unknown function (DUF4328)
MTDVWVCSTCHSINRQRNGSCYKCGAAQSAATGEMSGLRAEAAVANRAVGRYRSSRWLFVLAATLMVGFAVAGIFEVVTSLKDVEWLRTQIPTLVQTGTFDRAAYDTRLASETGPALLRLGFAIAALVAFAAWLSRVVSNVPTLGGGDPGITPTRAFVSTIIPLWNLIKVPGIIQNALYRLDPQAGGFFMVVLAWFGLVGSWFVSVIGGWVLGIGAAGSLVGAGDSPESLTNALLRYFDQVAALSIATALMVVLGALVLVLVMSRIERRARLRDEEIRALVLGRSDADGPSVSLPPEAAAEV